MHLQQQGQQECTVIGWIISRRSHRDVLFLDLRMAQGGVIQVVVTRETNGSDFNAVKKLPLESSVSVTGKVIEVDRLHKKELQANQIHVVSEATHKTQVNLRHDFDCFDPRNVDHVLSKRHIYLRHPKLAAIMRFRSLVMRTMRQWFDQHEVIEFTAPVLTPVPLYDDRTAISFRLAGDAAQQDPVFLTQCVGYYMEAAVHALGPVYNMGPSFRGERSKSNRHLMEYWHVKAEFPGGDLTTIMDLTGDLVSSTVESCRGEGERIAVLLGTRYAVKAGQSKYEQIGYRDAIAFLQNHGDSIQFGEGIHGDGERKLSEQFKGPFWIVGNPRTIEPFPYVIDSNDKELTRTADLICPEGYGELLGTAEKIIDRVMLDERLKEKGKAGDPRYEWIREMREFGMIPHTAFGMGLERFIRWLLGTSHVRDTIPFPRVFHRSVHP